MTKILPPNAARIAKDAGPEILALYTEDGLSCFREIYQAGVEQELVREGYFQPYTLPNGKQLFKKVVTGTVTVEHATREA